MKNLSYVLKNLHTKNYPLLCINFVSAQSVLINVAYTYKLSKALQLGFSLRADCKNTTQISTQLSAIRFLSVHLISFHLDLFLPLMALSIKIHWQLVSKCDVLLCVFLNFLR